MRKKRVPNECTNQKKPFVELSSKSRPSLDRLNVSDLVPIASAFFWAESLQDPLKSEFDCAYGPAVDRLRAGDPQTASPMLEKAFRNLISRWMVEGLLSEQRDRLEALALMIACGTDSPTCTISEKSILSHPRFQISRFKQCPGTLLKIKLKIFERIDLQFAYFAYKYLSEHLDPTYFRHPAFLDTVFGKYHYIYFFESIGQLLSGDLRFIARFDEPSQKCLGLYLEVYEPGFLRKAIEAAQPTTRSRKK